MDEHELEQRLRARLHARYDRGGPSEAFRSSLLRSLTPEAARGGGFRFALSAAWPILAAAAVLVIAVAVLSLRANAPIGPGASPIVSPTPTPTPTATPSVSPSATAGASASPSAAPSGPTGSTAPVSALPWTKLDVELLTGAPAALGSTAWAGGYLGFASASSGATSPWLSRDGRAWTELPAGTFGLDAAGSTELLGVAPCGNGVLVATGTPSTQVMWWSTDGIQWTSQPFTGVSRRGIAGGASGAVAPADSGLTARATTDCVTWQTVRLPASAGGTIRAIAAGPHGFVIVGYAGALGSPNDEPLAWTSPDGMQWSPSSVAAKKGDGFTSVSAGATGMVAFSTQPGVAPGISSMWTSVDGSRWILSRADPLGVVTNCAGSGSAAGQFIGDGTRLLAFGQQGGCGGAIEYWTSLNAAHWTKLTLTGAASAVTSDSGAIGASLMRDGILFGGNTGTWFGAATNP